MIPEIDLSSRYFLQSFAISFQSLGSISSESFMNGVSRIGLQISWSFGAMFRIACASVGITPPDFGSRREEIVPPVIIIATFGSLVFFSIVVILSGDSFDSSITLTVNISDSLIPML